MAQSLNQNFRYKVLDRCFRDRTRVYHRKDLIDAIEDEFRELGIFKRRPVVRTIDYDIENLKSGKIGVEAPIAWTEELGYHYTDPNFSLYKVTLKANIIRDLTQSITILKQITGDQHFTKIKKSIEALEAELHLRIEEEKGSLICLEKSTNHNGIKWISYLYDIILQQKTLLIDYIPFESELMILKISPCQLYEYNNRWYLIGWDHENKRMVSLGLDRIKEINYSIIPYFIPEDFNIEAYTKDLYGMTRPKNATPVNIIFKASKLQSQYLKTKPIHHSQKCLQEQEDGALFQLFLIINYEIKSRLLSYGSTIEILEPQILRDSMKQELARLNDMYQM